MSEPLLLGLDVGTTATKATVLSAKGSVVASASVGYPIHRPQPEWAEQDADDWRRAVASAVQEIAATVDLSAVGSIGVTSQVDTHVLVDAHYEPLLPALLWQDVRSSDEADRLNEELGEPGRRRGWGDPRLLDASNPVPRGRWLARHHPTAWAAARWLLLPKDLVNAGLTGVAASDPLSSFKVVGADGAYVPGVRHSPGLAARLPPLRDPEQPVGVTLRPWHGVAAGTTVATGTMDGFANVLGSGLHNPGDAMVILGTSVIVASVGVGDTSGPGVVNFPPFRGRHVHAGPTQAGGDSLRWWTRVSGRPIEEVLDAAGTVQPGAGGIVFAPHLLGERAPLWDDEVRAWFTGISATTGFAELSRAVLEGVAYSARELLEAVDVAAGVTASQLVLSGGGSRSALWAQIIADVTGRVVRRSAEPDTAVVGAAMLGAAAASGADPWAQSAALARYDAVFRPTRSVRASYDELFDLYRGSYDQLKDLHRRLRLFRQQQT